MIIIIKVTKVNCWDYSLSWDEKCSGKCQLTFVYQFIFFSSSYTMMKNEDNIMSELNLLWYEKKNPRSSPWLHEHDEYGKVYHESLKTWNQSNNQL